MIEYWIPEKVEIEFNRNPEMGVCVLFKNNKFKVWGHINLPYSVYAKHRITSLMLSNKYSDFENDFIIINSQGEICSANCKTPVTVDNGVICVEGSKYFVKPVQTKKVSTFVGAANIAELNKKLIQVGIKGKANALTKKQNQLISADKVK